MKPYRTDNGATGLEEFRGDLSVRGVTLDDQGIYKCIAWLSDTNKGRVETHVYVHGMYENVNYLCFFFQCSFWVEIGPHSQSSKFLFIFSQFVIDNSQTLNFSVKIILWFECDK
jgi:hypothetical protein